MPQEQNISVFVRSRPLNSQERRSVVDVIPSKREVKVQSNSSSSSKDPRSFRFDQVFGPESRQQDVYDKVVSPLIDQVLQGFNCTVFAYGQTGTGKTYTMEGKRSDLEIQWEDDPNLGIIPRAISQLFDTLNGNKHEFTIRVSFLELYNEDAYNLLSSVEDTTKLKIFDDAKNKGSVIFGGGLSEVIVTSKAEIYDILRRGSEKRQTAATLMNACSSRSHTIFSVTVHIREGSIDGEDILKTGKLNLVDLAGSENIGRSGALDKRAREAGNINQSLLTLGRVITALVEKRPHVPYRESKLTRLLQDSLGGKTKTSIIATISPAPADLEDTLSTLDYASRAKKIMNRPEMNQRLTRKAEALELRREVERLQRDLKAAWEKNGITLDEENYNEMRKQAAAAQDMNERMNAYLEEIEKNKKLFQDFKSNYEATKAKLDEAEEESRRKVKLFQKKEEQLLSHANKLAIVAKNAAQDAYLLQTKKERIENALKENRAHLDRYQDSFDSRLSRIENVIDSICADATQEKLYIQKLGERIENITTMAMTVKREFTSLRNETEHVLNRDIKDDAKTGQTPQKRTYDIPERMFKTELNDSILEDPEEGYENSNGA